MITQEYTSPSGLKFILREQTGDDDEKMSAAQSETTMVNTYVANVIVKGPDDKPMGPEEVKKLRLGDKYFLLLVSRILSLGSTLYFKYQWDGSNESIEYEEDLNKFVWDYSTPYPVEGDPNFFDQRISPYPKEEFMNGTIGDIQIRMDYLDGHGEDYLLKLPPNQRTVNKELIARNLRMFDGKDWKAIVNFKSFSARDMIYIRNLAHDNDPPIDGLMALDNPFTGEKIDLPILGIKDFFYPVKI